jgi:hypothetical protein
MNGISSDAVVPSMLYTLPLSILVYLCPEDGSESSSELFVTSSQTNTECHSKVPS